MLARTLDPRVVSKLVGAGWTVMYGPQLISFTFDHRAVFRFDDGRIEIEDRHDPLGAPELSDPVWRKALATLGIETGLLGFDQARRGWTQPLVATG